MKTDGQKKRGGRRDGSGRKATGLKKSERVTFYATAEEKARIFAEAETCGISVGEYILQCCRDFQTIPAPAKPGLRL